MLGEILEDPFLKEGSKTNLNKSIKGLGLLPLKTTFFKNKRTKQINSKSIWPDLTEINGFEIHNGTTELNASQDTSKIKPIFKDLDLGWYKVNSFGGITAGTYIHGIFENDEWRDQYINLIRRSRNLPLLDKKTKSYRIKRESIIENLAIEFNKHFDMSPILT